MKKYILSFLIFIFLLFFSVNLYWFYRYDKNNLVLILNNMNAWVLNTDTIPPININLYIDDELFLKEEKIDHMYNIYTGKTSLGTHKILIEVDSVHTYETNIWILPMKWIIMDYDCINGFLVTQFCRPPTLQ